MDNRWTELVRRGLLVIVLVLCAIGFQLQGVNADCELLNVPVSTGLTLKSEFKSNYTTGEIAVYKCSDGFSYVSLKCEDAGWGEVDRDCSDDLPVGMASIGGMVIFAAAVITSALFVGIATKHHKEMESQRKSQAASSEDKPTDQVPST